MKEPWCPHCLDKPLFGCVACPREKSKEEKKLDEIELEINSVFQSNKGSLANESRKRYDALLRIRKIIRRGKKE